MPAGDRTGPWGAGPRSGRRLGYCSGYAQPGSMTPGPGMGLGFGYGRGSGRGYGRGYGMGCGFRFRHAGPWGPGFTHPPAVPFGYPPGAVNMPRAEEEAGLAEEAQFLEAELGRIRERMSELKKAAKNRKAED
jgi:hypothetical protein